MPRIQLKSRSPEFADDAAPRQATRTCDMPGCSLHGECKAPKDRSLREYYFFCVDHAREYNSAWDFFSGMPLHEVEDHIVKSYHGDRPTWKYGVGGDYDYILRRKIWQDYHFTDEEPPKTGAGTRRVDPNTPEFEAMAIMGLAPPLSMEAIKARYKELVKIHHPDLNPGDRKAEELLKKINMAYTILRLACEKFAELPDRP